LRFEHRPLTPEQWGHLKRHVIRSAQRDRAQALRRMIGDDEEKIIDLR